MVSRRDFLLKLTGATALLALLPTVALFKNRKEKINLLKDPWLTIAKVQEDLFPSTVKSPIGAKQIQALNYLRKSIFASPEIATERKVFLKRGVQQINKLSKRSYQKNFVDLSFEERESVLTAMTETRSGERWLSLLLSYILEALLGDPIYGGNPKEIGWRWLNHQPGYPLPVKPYYEMLKR